MRQESPTLTHVRNEMKTVYRLYRAGAISRDSVVASVGVWLTAIEIDLDPRRQLPPARNGA
jgi:hypothetical protein